MKNTGARIRSYKLSAFLLTADNCLRKLVNTNIFRRKKIEQQLVKNTGNARINMVAYAEGGCREHQCDQ
jgi:hypothetical protein